MRGKRAELGELYATLAVVGLAAVLGIGGTARQSLAFTETWAADIFTVAFILLLCVAAFRSRFSSLPTYDPGKARKIVTIEAFDGLDDIELPSVSGSDEPAPVGDVTGKAFCDKNGRDPHRLMQACMRRGTKRCTPSCCVLMDELSGKTPKRVCVAGDREGGHFAKWRGREFDMSFYRHLATGRCRGGKKRCAEGT